MVLLQLVRRDMLSDQISDAVLYASLCRKSGSDVETAEFTHFSFILSMMKPLLMTKLQLISKKCYSANCSLEVPR